VACNVLYSVFDINNGMEPRRGQSWKIIRTPSLVFLPRFGSAWSLLVLRAIPNQDRSESCGGAHRAVVSNNGRPRVMSVQFGF
jgi:hypothetical protein